MVAIYRTNSVVYRVNYGFEMSPTFVDEKSVLFSTRLFVTVRRQNRWCHCREKLLKAVKMLFYGNDQVLFNDLYLLRVSFMVVMT